MNDGLVKLFQWRQISHVRQELHLHVVEWSEFLRLFASQCLASFEIEMLRRHSTTTSS